MRAKLLAIPILSTVFGAIAGTTVDAVLPMTVFGLIWGTVAAAIAPRVARWGADTATWSDAMLFFVVALAFIALGAALLGNLLVTSPSALLDLLQYDNFGIFFYAIHGPFEWLLMPALLMLNWHRPTRRWLILAAAATFYAGRIASALYFAPNALDWGGDPATADLDQVRLWINLDWLRLAAQDTATAVLLLLAAARAGARQPATTSTTAG